MIELPESHTLSNQMSQTLTGKTISFAIAAQTPHGFAFYSGDPADYGARLLGRSITAVQGFGSYVELDLQGLTLLLNDGTTPRYLEAGRTRPAKHQLLLEFEGGDALVCTVQMYGGLRLAEGGGESDNFYYNSARQNPHPLSDGFTRAYFDAIIQGAKPALSAKALLATEQRIPGLGNGCLQDILFEAGVHPQSKIGFLEPGDFDHLYHAVRSVLSDMTAMGGRSTERDLYGNPGGYPVKLCAKTLKYPCLKCGGPLARKAFLGGNVTFCAACQPLKN